MHLPQIPDSLLAVTNRRELRFRYTLDAEPANEADAFEQFRRGGASGRSSVQVWEHDRWPTHSQQCQADEEAELEAGA